MATVTQWTGAVSENYDVSGNWTNGVPVTDGTADVYFTEGNVDCLYMLPKGAADIDWLRLTIGPKYTGTIGSTTIFSGPPDSTNPLCLGELATFVYAQKSGQTIIHANVTGSTHIESTSVDNPSLLFREDEGATRSLIAGEVYITGGNGNVVFQNVQLLLCDIYMMDCNGVTVEIDQDCTLGANDIFLGAGRLIMGAIPSTNNIVVTGGMLEITDQDNYIDNLTMHGGICRWNVTPDATRPLITNLIMQGGLLDARGATAPEMTITNGTIYEGSIIDERNGLANITYTNPIVTHGGVVLCDPFRTIAVA